MELQEAYGLIAKNMEKELTEIEFSKYKTNDDTLAFKGDRGLFRIKYDSEGTIFLFECAYQDKGESTEFKQTSKILFDLKTATEKDCKSVANEVIYEAKELFKARKPVDLDKIKMPKSVSKGQVNRGATSYDTDSLANRFGTLYPEFKNEIKRNIAKYGEFLPEEFFMTKGTPKVLSVIENGTEAERTKLFKMLNEVYEDGTNEVQDIIGVTILGEMKGDAHMMSVADDYMSEYMAGPVHEINKITRKKNKYTKQLKNPPVYKPPKKKKSPYQSQLLNQ